MKLRYLLNVFLESGQKKKKKEKKKENYHSYFLNVGRQVNFIFFFWNTYSVFCPKESGIYLPNYTNPTIKDLVAI